MLNVSKDVYCLQTGLWGLCPRPARGASRAGRRCGADQSGDVTGVGIVANRVGIVANSIPLWSLDSSVYYKTLKII